MKRAEGNESSGQSKKIKEDDSDKDDYASQLETAKKGDREHYVNAIKSMLREHASAVSTVSQKNILHPHSEDVIANADRILLEIALNNIVVYTLEFFHGGGNAVASETFLTKEEAEKTAEKWNKILNAQTMIIEHPVNSIQSLNDLFAYKVLDKPTLPRMKVIINYVPKGWKQSNSFRVEIKSEFFDEVCQYLLEKKKTMNIVFFFSYRDCDLEGSFADFHGFKDLFEIVIIKRV